MIIGRQTPSRAVVEEEALRRWFDGARHGIEPDPLFRRRLRGSVLNRFVAHREGIATPPRLGSGQAMGVLGRATLVASVAVAMSVGGVMAAAQSTIPGDLLYPVKREIEQVRLAIVPDEYHDALRTHMLAERLAELSRLVADGEVARASALADVIAGNWVDPVAGSARGVDGRLNVLHALVERLPEQAREAISRSVERMEQRVPGRQVEADRGGTRSPNGGGGSGEVPESDHDSHAPEAETPTPDARVEPSPKTTTKPSPSPSRSPRAEESAPPGEDDARKPKSD